MRGPKPSYPIELTNSEAEDLRRLGRAHTTGQALAVRAQIVLTANAHPDWITNALPTPSGPVIAWCANGGAAGSPPVG